MATAMQELKAELAGLTEQERPSWLISCSIRSTVLATMPMLKLPGMPNLHDAQDEIQRGTAVGKPADQVFAELREK